MTDSLDYTVLNSQIVDVPVQTEVDGQSAWAMVRSRIVEAQPATAAGRTLTVVLPLDTVDQYPAGSSLRVTLEQLDVPQPTPAEPDDTPNGGA